MLNRVSAAELISCGKARRRLAGMCEETFENYQQVRISGGSGLAGGEGRTISKHGVVPPPIVITKSGGVLIGIHLLLLLWRMLLGLLDR